MTNINMEVVFTPLNYMMVERRKISRAWWGYRQANNTCVFLTNDTATSLQDVET
jgi:hypothetical protein